MFSQKPWFNQIFVCTNRIVIVWNANHLAGMEITIVTTVFSILKIVNGMEEIAVVTASTQTTAP